MGEYISLHTQTVKSDFSLGLNLTAVGIESRARSFFAPLIAISNGEDKTTAANEFTRNYSSTGCLVCDGMGEKKKSGVERNENKSLKIRISNTHRIICEILGTDTYRRTHRVWCKVYFGTE